jgi:hypothetical protein
MKIFITGSSNAIYSNTHVKCSEETLVQDMDLNETEEG